jgi:hypothetical protein
MEMGRGPGRISEGGAGTVYPKGENSLAPEAATRKGDRGPERSGSDAFLPTAAANGAAAFRTPIARAGDGGGADDARPFRSSP